MEGLYSKWFPVHINFHLFIDQYFSGIKREKSILTPDIGNAPPAKGRVFHLNKIDFVLINMKIHFHLRNNSNELSSSYFVNINGFQVLY